MASPEMMDFINGWASYMGYMGNPDNQPSTEKHYAIGYRDQRPEGTPDNWVPLGGTYDGINSWRTLWGDPGLVQHIGIKPWNGGSITDLVAYGDRLNYHYNQNQYQDAMPDSAKGYVNLLQSRLSESTRNKWPDQPYRPDPVDYKGPLPKSGFVIGYRSNRPENIPLDWVPLGASEADVDMVNSWWTAWGPPQALQHASAWTGGNKSALIRWAGRWGKSGLRSYQNQGNEGFGQGGRGNQFSRNSFENKLREAMENRGNQNVPQSNAPSNPYMTLPPPPTSNAPQIQPPNPVNMPNFPQPIPGNGGTTAQGPGPVITDPYPGPTQTQVGFQNPQHSGGLGVPLNQQQTLAALLRGGAAGSGIGVPIGAG